MRKKIMSIVAIAFLSIGFTVAQSGSSKFENKNPEEIAKMKTQKMVSNLDLSGEQAQSVNGIIIESETRKADIQRKYPQIEEAKKEMKEFRKSQQAEVQGILTPDQQEKLKTLKKPKRSKNGEEPKEEKLKKMQSELGLSDQQTKELKVVFDKSNTQREELKAKYPELEQAKIEMKANKEETDKQLKAVLTAEQYSKLQERGPKMGHRKGCEDCN